MVPKVSVVIPVYNVERYIQKCIDTLVAQTLREIELIFVDDCSPDSSVEIIEKNRKQYPEKIKIIRLEKNLRQGGARNVGIRVAKADFIGFVDSDDYVSNDMFEKLYKVAASKNCDAVYSKARYVYGNAPQKEPYRCVYQWDDCVIKLDNKILSDNDRMNLMCFPVGGVWSALYRKDIVLKNDVFFPEHLKYEDNYWCSLIKAYFNKVCFVEDVLYYYRQNNDSTTHCRNEIFQLDRLKTEMMLIDAAVERNIFKRYYDAFEYMFAIRYCVNTIFIIASHFDSPDFGVMNKIRETLDEKFPYWYKNSYLRTAGSLNTKIKVMIVKLKLFKLIYLFYKLKNKL